MIQDLESERLRIMSGRSEEEEEGRVHRSDVNCTMKQTTILEEEGRSRRVRVKKKSSKSISSNSSSSSQLAKREIQTVEIEQKIPDVQIEFPNLIESVKMLQDYWNNYYYYYYYYYYCLISGQIIG